MVHDAIYVPSVLVHVFDRSHLPLVALGFQNPFIARRGHPISVVRYHDAKNGPHCSKQIPKLFKWTLRGQAASASGRTES